MIRRPPRSTLFPLHDALPISFRAQRSGVEESLDLLLTIMIRDVSTTLDRKSTRLNSSHITISYAVFCLKKKKKKYTTQDIKGKWTRLHCGSCNSLVVRKLYDL